jgi:hypothetical protein
MVALLATAITIVIGILINLITTPPLPGWLRWLKPGWRPVTALLGCAAASAVLAVLLRRTDRIQATAIQGKSQPKLQPHYDENSAQYRHPSPDASWVIYHRVGLFNAHGAESLRHVRVHLVGMSPLPRHLNGFDPVIPYAVPMLSDGDTSIGITLAPGREELWVLGYTSTGSDGNLNAGGFAPLTRGGVACRGSSTLTSGAVSATRSFAMIMNRSSSVFFCSQTTAICIVV